MHSAAQFARLTLGVVLVFAAVGCGGTSYSTAPVSGTVTLNGKALADASVQFQPAMGGNPGPPSYGTTDDEGHFTLAFRDEKPGAVVGKHRVIITTRQFGPRKDNPDAEEELVKEQVPDSYATEPPMFDVPKGGTEGATIELIGPPPSNIPPGEKKRDLHG